MKRRVFIVSILGVAVLGLIGFMVWRIGQNRQADLFSFKSPTSEPSPNQATTTGWLEYQKEAEAIFGGDKAVLAVIKKVLGEDIFVRDIEPVPGEQNIYLAIYIENPVFDNDPDLSLAEKGLLYFSCPETTMGQGTSGTYHLAAFRTSGQAVDLVNDEVLRLTTRTDNPVPDQPRLSFRNTRFNLETSTACQAGFAECREDQKTILVAKLLKFSDLTGDGKANEFKVVGDQTPCGHIETGIAGFNTKALLYPIYTNLKATERQMMFDNFVPDKNGEVSWQFTCGDHGNQIEQNKLFRFDAKKQAYILVSSSEKTCK